MLYYVPNSLPPKNYRKSVEELAESISDPVRKLKFLKHVIGDYYKKPPHDRQNSSLTGINFEAAISDPSGTFTGPIWEESPYPLSPAREWITKHRRTFISSILIASIWAIGLLILSLVGMINTADTHTELEKKTPLEFYPILSRPIQKSLPPQKIEAPQNFPAYLDEPIWLVENKPDIEIYSNRLQIITTYTIENIPRSYIRFPKNASSVPEQYERSDKINGILFHAAESDLFDFRPEMNLSIKKYSKALIRYLCKKKSYNYFIDRFGLVYRIVREDHAAFHAGNSLWSDEELIYLNLNHAFIGICFEGKDFKTVEPSKDALNKTVNTPNIAIMESSSINEAQLRSGKELTDFLRVKYHIHQHNCVTHGLVSINPNTFLIGHHLDLSYGFPFNEYKLNDKYKEPLPTIAEFGFSYDDFLTEIFKGELWPGIYLSEELMAQQADQSQCTLPEYKKFLNDKYTQLFQWQKTMAAKIEPPGR